VIAQKALGAAGRSSRREKRRHKLLARLHHSGRRRGCQVGIDMPASASRLGSSLRCVPIRPGSLKGMLQPVSAALICATSFSARGVGIIAPGLR
jgi:hypothetical protein